MVIVKWIVGSVAVVAGIISIWFWMHLVLRNGLTPGVLGGEINPIWLLYCFVGVVTFIAGGYMLLDVFLKAMKNYQQKRRAEIFFNSGK